MRSLSLFFFLSLPSTVVLGQKLLFRIYPKSPSMTVMMMTGPKGRPVLLRQRSFLLVTATLLLFVVVVPVKGFVLPSDITPLNAAKIGPRRRDTPQIPSFLASTENDDDDIQDKTVEGHTTSPSETIKDNNNNNNNNSASKRKMLGFAIPALGIYLANPLLSNIDNSFVGRTVGTRGLAALSPATICTDQMLYLFSFLSRATTGLVSREFGSKTDPREKEQAAATAGSAPLSVALMSGFLLTIFYALFTPKLLSILNVTPALRGPAASYIYWRGSIAWAALAQAVSLSVMMATQDAITPLKIIGLAAIVNVIGDFLLCVWPVRWGCAGAAAATSFATLISCGFMIKALKKKRILPKLRLPTRKEISALTEFTGPLFAITITRLIGFISMQRAAMRLGVKQLAAYQLSINLVIFFLLFGEPLSQLSQTQLPSLIDAGDGPSVRANLKSVLTLGLYTALGIGSIAGASLFFGSSIFTSDAAVQALAKQAAPSVFLTVATATLAVTVDGAMLASRDFGFMLVQGLGTMFLQLFLLATWCQDISQIFSTFTLRLGSYAAFSMLRFGLGFGALGRVIRSNKKEKDEDVSKQINGLSITSVATNPQQS